MLFSLPIWLLRLVFLLSQHWPWLARRINAEIIDASARAGRRRPHPWSTVHPYISWTSLTDQTWSARHLPAASLKNLPPPEKVSEFFQAAASGQAYCKKSTLLFPAFAQYLTDGFIRTVMPNESAGESPNLRRKNTSNHQIDLCPLYGRNQEQTRALRLLSQEPGRKGRLKSQDYNGEEYAPFLFDSEGREKTEFEKLDRILGLDQVATIEQKKTLFAFGGDRVNSAPQVAMINTLLLREHNRISGEIERAHPDWDDERIFQVARNVLIAIFIKIVVEDYINHIAPTPFSIKTDLSVAWTAPWNKPNWITVEFSLLYRWHSLIPASTMWNKKVYPVENTFFNNALLLDSGLAQAFIDMSSQKATRLGALNTAPALRIFEERALRQSRTCEVDTYSKYRKYMTLKEPVTFEDFSTNPAVVRKLQELYSNPKDVEFYVGLFAEDTVENSPLPELLLRMVAVDAFTQALTNPLLSEHVFKEATFSAPGWQTIHETSSLRDLVKRNCSLKSNASFVGMTQPDWSYAWPASTAVDAVRHGASLLTGTAGRNKTAGFVISTVGEVVGLVLWLQLTLAGSGAFGFTWLVAGEAIEWSLLAYMIITSRLSHPKATGQVGAGLLKTALISLSEALLWVVWLFLIQRIGLVLATAALAVAMHVKHDAEMSVFTGRGFLKNALDSRDLVASGLEVFGAGVWYALTTAGYPILGGLVLLVCISIEHILQFVTAGFLEPEQPEHAPPPSPPV